MLPRVVGQVPLYYAHRSTGKPASKASFLHIDEIAVEILRAKGVDRVAAR